jgi:hypothetical protein
MALVVGVAVVWAGPAAADYIKGFTWDRSADYDPGTVPGSSLGNPNTDAEGNGVWQMESTDLAGDGLGGINPWYQGPTQVQVWDDSWYGGGPAWTRGDNVNPPMSAGDMTHNVGGGTYGNIPLVRWLNPVEHGLFLDIEGTLTERWRGGGGVSSNVDFDVVIAHYDLSTDTYNVLFGQLFEKPTDDNSWEDLSVPVSISNYWVAPGDAILISHRGLSTAGSTWPNLQDDLVFELHDFPEPGTVTLLVFGGLGLLARRRRRRSAT